MAAVPALHTLVHKDSADPDHQCAVTFFTHGQAHYSETLVEPSRAVLLVLQRAPVPATIFVSRDLRFLPCRGPPARFASI